MYLWLSCGRIDALTTVNKRRADHKRTSPMCLSSPEPGRAVMSGATEYKLSTVEALYWPLHVSPVRFRSLCVSRVYLGSQYMDHMVGSILSCFVDSLICAAVRRSFDGRSPEAAKAKPDRVSRVTLTA